MSAFDGGFLEAVDRNDSTHDEVVVDSSGPFFPTIADIALQMISHRGDSSLTHPTTLALNYIHELLYYNHGPSSSAHHCFPSNVREGEHHHEYIMIHFPFPCYRMSAVCAVVRMTEDMA